MADDPRNTLRFVHSSLRSASYKGAEPLAAIAAEIGLAVSDLVKLNANENVYGTHPAVKAAVETADHSVYPDPAQADFRVALAKLHDTTPEHIVAGAGSDDILDIVIRLVRPETVVICTPTFGMYTFLSTIFGCNVVDVPRDDDFNIRLPEVIAAIRKHKASIVFLPSPNNPTGTLLSEHAILEILKEEDTILVVDEAYADFCDYTAIPLINDHPNLIVTRTFSKWAGLAGLRIGYGIADPTMVRYMMAIKQPYNISTAANAAGLAALEHYDEIMKTVAALRAERDNMFKQLQTIPWLRVIPSEANFILAEVMGKNAREVEQFLRRKGILIRYFGTQGGALSSYIRISAGKPEDTAAVMATLKQMP